MKRAPFSTQIDLSKFKMTDFEKATEDEKRQQDVMGESTTFFRDGMRRLRKNPLAMASIVVLVLLLLIIFIAPHVVPYGYADIVKGSANLKPFAYSTAEQAKIKAGESVFPHIFGTDSLGRDYFIRVVYGARVSLGVGVFASLLVLIRYCLRFHFRLPGRKSGSGNDAYCGYHLFPAGYAVDYPVGSGIKRNTDSSDPGYDSGKTGCQHDFPVYRIWTVILGRYGSTDSWSDSYH